MAPASRKQPARQPPPTPAANAIQSQSPLQIQRTDALTDFQARRLQRRLDELERTNPTDIPATSFVTPPTKNNAVGEPGSKKKQSANVRKILYAKKGLKDWLDELPRDPIPPYVTAVAPPPKTPSRRICSSCGYLGSYKCPRCAEWSCDRTCVEVHERDGGCGVGA